MVVESSGYSPALRLPCAFAIATPEFSYTLSITTASQSKENLHGKGFTDTLISVGTHAQAVILSYGF